MKFKDFLLSEMSGYAWTKGDKRIESASSGHFFTNSVCYKYHPKCSGVLDNATDIFKIMPSWRDMEFLVSYGLTKDDIHVTIWNW